MDDDEAATSGRRDPFSRQSRVLGWLLAILGAAFILLFKTVGRMEAHTSFLLGAAIAGIGGAIGFALLARSKRHFAKRADAILTRSNRPPVLYLRKFDDDDEGWEERVARSLSRIGPVVAIGDPRDKLPPPGAARLYAADDDWQTKVSALIEGSALIALKAGDTTGIRWEVEQVLSRVPPSRVLLFLPMSPLNRKRVDQSRYRAFLGVAGHLFPKPLPDLPDLGDVIHFDRDWTPRLVATWNSARKEAASSQVRADNRATAFKGLADEFEFRLRRRDMAVLALPVVLMGAIAAPWAIERLAEFSWWGMRTSEQDLIDRAQPAIARITETLRTALASEARPDSRRPDEAPSPRPIYGALDERPNTDIVTRDQALWLTGSLGVEKRPALSTSLVPAARLLRRYDRNARSRRPSEAFARTLETAAGLVYVAIVAPGEVRLARAGSPDEWRAMAPCDIVLLRLENGSTATSTTAEIATTFKEIDETQVGGKPVRRLRRPGEDRPSMMPEGADLYEFLGWRVRRANEPPDARVAFARNRIEEALRKAVVDELARATGGRFAEP